MFKFSLIKFVVGALILVVSYFFPAFLMPLGEYSYEEKNVEYSLSFDFAKRMEVEVDSEWDVMDSEQKYFYKIELDLKDGNCVVFSDSKDNDIKTEFNTIKIKNIYTLEFGGQKYKNYFGLGFAIVGFVLAGWGLVGFFVPKKKKG